jgi:hypothetical protein
MAIKTINLTHDVEKILDLIIKENPNFNFSGWVQSNLKDFHNKKNIYSNEDNIDDEINYKKGQIKLLLIDINTLISKKIDLKNLNEKLKLEEEHRQNREEERENINKISVNQFFKEETGRDITDEEYIEYKNGQYDTIFDYIKKHNIENGYT